MLKNQTVGDGSNPSIFFYQCRKCSYGTRF